MIIFVDGSQGAGKTTLIEGYQKENFCKILKFPFSLYSQKMNFKNKKTLKGFQVGKDLAALYWFNHFDFGEEIIFIDRGPFSSVYYSLTTKRMRKKEVKSFLELIKENQKRSDINYIFVKPINQKEKYIRKKGDGFDKLSQQERNKEKALCYIEKCTKKMGIKLNIFENDFSKSISENLIKFEELLRSLEL